MEAMEEGEGIGIGRKGIEEFRTRNRREESKREGNGEEKGGEMGMVRS